MSPSGKIAVLIVAIALAGRTIFFVGFVTLIGFFLYATRSVLQAWAIESTPKHLAGAGVGLQFGQPRQEDLVAYLAANHTDDEVSALGSELATMQASLPQVFRGTAPIVVEGNPSDKIMQQAKHDVTDLIVLGRTPTDAFSRWLLGSTSEAVLTHAAASVLIVPVEKRS